MTMLRLIGSGSGYLLHCRSISSLPVVALVRSNFRCQDCGGTDAYRSRRRTLVEKYIHPMFLLKPVRCAKLLPQANRTNVRHCPRTGEWDALPGMNCLLHFGQFWAQPKRHSGKGQEVSCRQ